MTRRRGGSAWKAALIVVVCGALSAACADQHVVNKINLVQTVSYDAEEEGVKSAVLVASYKEKGKTELQLLDTASSSVFDVLPRLNTKTNRPLEYGQLRMAVFGEAYARKGIGTVIHSLCRDPKISTRMQLGVADGVAADLLNVAETKQAAYYLADMIEQNAEEGNLPSLNLHTAFFSFYGAGRDMYLPYFTVERGEIKIDGLALFKDDRFVARVGIRDAFLLKLLTEKTRSGSYMIPVSRSKRGDQGVVLLNNLGSKARFDVLRVGPPSSVAVRVALDAQVKDVPAWIDLTSKSRIARLERTIGTYLEEEIDRFIAYCRERRVDPIGFGDLVRSRSKAWDARTFEDAYPSFRATVRVEVNIVQTGVGR